MPNVSRLTLPSGFEDLTSSKLLLPPEPVYVWANMLHASVAASELAKGADVPFGPTAERKLPTGGAPVPDLMMTDINYGAPGIASEAIAVAEFPNAQAGHTVKMNRTVFADTVYTMASRDVTRMVIAEDGVSLTGEQVEVTVRRFGGPYNTATSKPAPYMIESFDAARGVHDLSSMVSLHLRRDRIKTIDTFIGTMVVNGALSTQRVYPGDFANAITTDNAAFLTQGDRQLDLETVRRAESVAQINNIPTFSNGRYCLVITPKQALQLTTSSAWYRASVQQPDKNPLSSRYIGTIGNTDIVVSNTNPTATANSTITVQLGVLMGPGAIGYALASPPAIVAGDNTNFKQRIGVMWFSDEGFNVLDNRFLVSVRSN